MRSWFYIKDKQRQGPIDEDALIEMFAMGTLSTDTLVWTKGLIEWTLARNVETLIPEDTPPPLDTSSSPFPDASWVPPHYDEYRSGPQVRPWPRFWARYIDVFLFAILGGLILGIVYPPALKANEVFLGMLLAFAYVFVEPIMLSSWGTTPGKALLRIQLRRYDGTKLTFSEGLDRAFKVWLKGEGIGFPLVALITQISAYNRLIREGKTSWDRDGHFLYSHRVVGPLRVVLAVLLIIGFIILMVLGNTDT